MLALVLLAKSRNLSDDSFCSKAETVIAKNGSWPQVFLCSAEVQLQRADTEFSSE